MTSLSFEGFWSAIARMEREGTLPDWAVDHQGRSRASRERTLEAAYRLIADASELTMDAVAELADLSIGALYARFPSKEAVLVLLGLAVLEDGFLYIERALSDQATVTQIMRSYVSRIVAVFRRHRAVILEMLRLRTGSPDMARIIRTTNERIHELVRSRLHPLLPDSLHERLEFALFMASAAAREGVLHDALAVYRTDAGDEDLAGEICRAMEAYLGMEEVIDHTPQP